jgi:hypothetical protein
MVSCHDLPRHPAVTPDRSVVARTTAPTQSCDGRFVPRERSVGRTGSGLHR